MIKCNTMGSVLALLLLLGCEKSPAPIAAEKSAAPEVEPKITTTLTIPPPQQRPAHLGAGIKWAPESKRYQQIRTEAYREGVDFINKVDTRTRRESRHGHYVVEVIERPKQPTGQFEQWLIAVTDAQGKPVTDARIHIKGGMPEHGHGMPSQPTVSAGSKPGQYTLDGLQFSMPGWWEVSLYLSSQRQDDSVTLNLIVG